MLVLSSTVKRTVKTNIFPFFPLVKTNFFPFYPPSPYTYLPKTDICKFFFFFFYEPFPNFQTKNTWCPHFDTRVDCIKIY